MSSPRASGEDPTARAELMLSNRPGNDINSARAEEAQQLTRSDAAAASGREQPEAGQGASDPDAAGQGARNPRRSRSARRRPDEVRQAPGTRTRPVRAGGRPPSRRR
ncbi:hypothetical protein BN12_2840011 [Nostocoides japonicum T1-X7]|uniref:Uncharacterized protein n=1 Tax=Nostocoides japonicum T1-X7 TaxID=1194083 RepID=A0A077LWU4_9MICO|nr:hypothetical protein BN12_2840011 [Tetrasphaera japonica T1-X7]